jgi:hypothetical protein
LVLLLGVAVHPVLVLVLVLVLALALALALAEGSPEAPVRPQLDPPAGWAGSPPACPKQAPDRKRPWDPLEAESSPHPNLC